MADLPAEGPSPAMESELLAATEEAGVGEAIQPKGTT